MIKGKTNITLVTGFAALIFAGIVIWWLTAKPSYEVVERIPGMDNRPPRKQISDTVIIGEHFDTLGKFDEVVPGNWPRFRGEDLDNISKDLTPLAESWDTSGPPVLWSTALGEGYAGPAVMNGRVYVLDYSEKRKADMLRCFSLKSGTELWRRWYTVEFKRNHGYSRTIPAVTDKYVVTIGPRSHVMCVDPVDGKLLWTLDLEKKYGIPDNPKGRITQEFFCSQCPLIDNGMAIIAPGGKALMIGVDCATGNVVWETPNRDSIMMSYTSIVPMTIAGKRMYVYAGLGGTAGVSAESADIGKTLWSTKDWNPSIAVASPVCLGNNEFVAFGSYGEGAARIRIAPGDSGFKATVVEKHKANAGIANEQQTPILKGNYVWMVMADNSGPLRSQLACFDKSNLVTPVWSSGKEKRLGRGNGPFLMSGNRMFILDDEGTLYMFRIEGERATLISSHKMMNAVEAWAPMALAGRYLILRDAHNMMCINVGPLQSK